VRLTIKLADVLLAIIAAGVILATFAGWNAL
jgi:hypothetical protein